jgi:hypothetical protein
MSKGLFSMLGEAMDEPPRKRRRKTPRRRHRDRKSDSKRRRAAITELNHADPAVAAVAPVKAVAHG